jgi:hypothetical protein
MAWCLVKHRDNFEYVFHFHSHLSMFQFLFLDCRMQYIHIPYSVYLQNLYNVGFFIYGNGPSDSISWEFLD